MPGIPHSLKGLRIHEISLVDAPANPGALHVLFKRKDAAMSAATVKPSVKSADPSTLDRLLVRLGLSKRATSDPLDPDTYADSAAQSVDSASDALSKSIKSILEDAQVIDKAAAIDASLAQFRGFLGEQMPAQIEKAMRDVALAASVAKKDDRSMPTSDEMTASIADLTKQLATMKIDLAKVKMSSKHSQYMSDMGMDDDAQAAFAGKSPDERDAAMAAKPVKKQDDNSESAVALRKAQADTEDLRKRVAVFEADREIDLFRKRAVSIGLGESQAETILKASKGDQAAFGAVLDLIKAANAQGRTSKLFSEFGSVGKAMDGSAAAEVAAEAEALRKADPKLSLVMARVAVRKANLDLAAREREEEKQGLRTVT